MLIQRHILDLQCHENVYKMIASDANNDGKITASDLVELRKLILGVTNTFNNKSWRLPKKLQNLDLTYPFPYTEGYSENPLMLPMQKVDFVAVKIGDINGNASGAQQNIVEPRSNKKLNFEVANVVLEPQERIYATRVCIQLQRYLWIPDYIEAQRCGICRFDTGRTGYRCYQYRKVER
ncbi:MAG: hypothetical protein IPJ13_11130 [Saprospiraceae bacterium]|nr:hypothetical protein [Saprospiraceae bacterium]